MKTAQELLSRLPKQEKNIKYSIKELKHFSTTENPEYKAGENVKIEGNVINVEGYGMGFIGNILIHGIIQGDNLYKLGESYTQKI